jgi:hypothetical protein
MAKLTPEDLRDILIELQGAGLDAVIVGGQAVNLWAIQYSQQSPLMQKLQPFASEDLDFYGGKLEAVICHDALGGDINLNEDFDPSPNAGVVLVKRNDGNLRIDILASVYGLNDAEITATARTFRGKGKLEGLNLKVLHPVLCLEGKLRCLRGLPQGGRQDLKHVKMSMLAVHCLLHELCQQSDPRPALKIIERVLSGGLREDGLQVWSRHQLFLESCLPFDIIKSSQHEQFQQFTQIRLPQILGQVSDKRQRYWRLMSREGRKNVLTGEMPGLILSSELMKNNDVRDLTETKFKP